MEILTEYLDRPILPGRVWDLVIPGTSSQSVSIFFIHGGGWRMGSRDRFHTIMEALADRGFACASTDYRLEGVLVPQQLTDVRYAYGRFVQSLRQKGLPPKVLAFGSSAGAHLALLLALAKPGACGDEPIADPAVSEAAQLPLAGASVQSAPVTFEPWEDIFPGMWKPMQNAVGTPYSERPDLYTKVSPIHYINDVSPAVFIMEAQYEHMIPPPVIRQFYDRMLQAGRRVELKTYSGTEHGFFYDNKRRQQIEALEDLVAFARSLV